MWLEIEGGTPFLVAINSLPYACRTDSPEATFEIAASFASFLKEGEIVFLQGEMGTGKTHFARGVCAGLGMADLFEVDSPTYTLVNHYEVGPGVDHLDLYRMSDPEELEEINLDGILNASTIKLIEWPERLIGFPVKNVDYLIRLCAISDSRRQIEIQVPAGVFP